MMLQKQLELTPQDAAAERAGRELARRKFMRFARYVQPWWHAAPHLELVAEKLEQVLEYIESGGKRGIGRLMIQWPPRHGKTEIASKLFPAYLLGRLPNSRVILTSYAADMAQDNSRAVRALVTNPKYGALFGKKSAVDAPVELSEDSRAKMNWDLAAPHRGGVVAAGVGGGITGKGAHLLVIDDPFKNREEAESEARRQLVMSWYASSAMTRLEPGGAVVIMHTRWHREDLSGQLLKAMAIDPAADQWEVVCMPALAYEDEEYAADPEKQHQALLDGIYMPFADALGRKAGQALWPDKYNRDALEKIKANLNSTGNLVDWFSLYQQMPRPNEGVFFGWDDFKVIDAVEVPKELTWVRYVDLAIGESKGSDFNATVAEALDDEGNLYLRDMVRVQSWTEFKSRLKAQMLMTEERGVTWGIEATAFQVLAVRELMEDRELAGVSIQKMLPRADKVARARALQGRAKAGKVYLVRGPWVQNFISEALDFPHGRHDDQVDTASGGLELLAKLARNSRTARCYLG